MFHKVKSVKTLENYILEVTFQNNVCKYYDVSCLFDKWDIFKKLITTKGLFQQVKVDNGGFGISWNDEIDLSCNELWQNGYSNRDGFSGQPYLLGKFHKKHIQKKSRKK